MLALFNWEITSDLFFGTVSSVFSPNMFKKRTECWPFLLYCACGSLGQNYQKQNEMPAFFTREKIVFDLFFVLCRRFSFQICLKNRTECPPVLSEKCKFLGQKLTHFHTFWGLGVPPEASFQKGVQTTSKNLRILVFLASLLEAIFMFWGI